jgi:hypothetical protein
VDIIRKDQVKIRIKCTKITKKNYEDIKYDCKIRGKHNNKCEKEKYDQGQCANITIKKEFIRDL